MAHPQASDIKAKYRAVLSKGGVKGELLSFCGEYWKL